MAGRFSNAPVDFSQLNQIADSIIGSINKGRQAKAFQDALKSGADPRQAILNYAQQTGDMEGASRLAAVVKASQPPGMTPYQAGQLASSRDRTNAYRDHLRYLDDQPRVGSTVESVRAKLARGEQLSPNEQQLYRDTLSGDPFLRGIMPTMNAPGNPGTIATNPAPSGAAPSQFTEGQTATGPGGQRIVYRNGQWVPAQ